MIDLKRGMTSTQAAHDFPGSSRLPARSGSDRSRRTIHRSPGRRHGGDGIYRVCTASLFELQRARVALQAGWLGERGVEFGAADANPLSASGILEQARVEAATTIASSAFEVSASMRP
jgi:hypothetical protein